MILKWLKAGEYVSENLIHAFRKLMDRFLQSQATIARLRRYENRILGHLCFGAAAVLFFPVGCSDEEGRKEIMQQMLGDLRVAACNATRFRGFIYKHPQSHL